MSRPHKLKDARAERPAQPYLPDGTLDPREWRVANGAANVIALILCRGQPWFVEARPIEVIGQGVEIDVVVRWVSSEVYAKVPASVDGFTVNVVREGQTSEVVRLH